MVVHRPCCPMVRLTQDGEEEAESFAQLKLTYLHLVGDLPKSPLYFRDKICFSLLRLNLPRNKGFENWVIR